MALAVAAASLVAACGQGGNRNPPDQLLRDSLGLEETDRVFRVRVTSVENTESVRPSVLRVPPGAYVEFVTADRRLHTVTFRLDEMSAAAADFLRETRQDASPPLLELGSRFVVAFGDAPPGRYPYRVEGNGEPVRGTVVVAEEDGGRR